MNRWAEASGRAGLSPAARRCLTWAAIALALRSVLNLVVTSHGFSSVSDDDFARVAIAQTFSHAPRWDASGSSWLPFPFWLTGGVMRWTQTSWEVAKAVAWGTSLGSVVVFLLAGSAAGLRGAWLGLAAVGFAAMPHAVWLGLAPVPEGYAAVLALTGLCTLPNDKEKSRWEWLGAAALCAATLSRYETWPLALVAATFRIWHSRGQWRWRTGGLILVTLAGPMFWCLHGILDHGEALFFVRRVTNYRAALSGSPRTWLEAAANYPLALVTEEPAVFVSGAAAALAAAVRKPGARTPASPLRAPLGWGLAALLAFLIWGDLTNGAPTHHPERALLTAWLILWLLAVRGAQRWSGYTVPPALAPKGENPLAQPPGHLAEPKAVSQRSARGLQWALVGACVLIGSGLVRQPRQNFVDRSHELEIGRHWGPALSAGRRGFVETPGYGYTAVSVGSGRPWLIDGYTEADPRRVSDAPPWRDLGALRRYFAERQVEWVLAPLERGVTLEELGRRAADLGSLTLFELSTGSPRGK